MRLQEFELEQHAARFNEAAVRLLRAVIAESGREVFVGGNVGPTGKIIGQTATYHEVLDSMRVQIRALVRTGIDMLCVETVIQALDAQVAVEAAQGVFTEEGIRVPIYVTFAFMNRREGSPVACRTFFGDSVSDTMQGKEDLLAERKSIWL